MQDVSSLMHAKLEGNCVAFCGDESALNGEVANAFGSLVQYAPLSMTDLFERVTGKPVDQAVREDGRDSVAVTEAAILEELAMTVRCAEGYHCIARKMLACCVQA